MKQMILHTEIPGMSVIPTIGDGFSGSKFGGDLKECADYYNCDHDQPWISRGEIDVSDGSGNIEGRFRIFRRFVIASKIELSDMRIMNKGEFSEVIVLACPMMPTIERLRGR